MKNYDTIYDEYAEIEEDAFENMFLRLNELGIDSYMDIDDRVS